MQTFKPRVSNINAKNIKAYIEKWIFFISVAYEMLLYVYTTFGVHESSIPVAHPGYRVLSDILFRLGLIANGLTQCSS